MENSWTASVIMAAALLLWQTFGTPVPIWMEALGGMLIGGSVFLLAAMILKIGELQKLIFSLKKRLAG